MTHADAMALAAGEIDALIDRYLAAVERVIRQDIAATGPEDDAALDRPPDPGSPWRRITVEEILMREHAAMVTWRKSALMTLRDTLADLSENTKV